MPRQLWVEKKNQGKDGPTKVRFTKKKKTKWHPLSEVKPKKVKVVRTSQTESLPAVQYIQFVKNCLASDPKRFKQFTEIVKDLQDETDDLVNCIDDVVRLFDGYPDLIRGFNAFLPSHYEIEVQDEAVVIHHYEDELVQPKGNKRQDDALEYIMQAKKVLKANSEEYQQFMQAMTEFHKSKDKDVIYETVKKVVRILFHNPELVLGLQPFLPEQFCIHMYEKAVYTIHFPDHTGEMGTLTMSLEDR